ncbi:hypothetical protein Q4E93_07635 [Flavitalea sp. BT771]|uniref:hypothetical protein n=1 Tax=Flavitalea sp. BT771 TaxID=3063329 RepID=UPI0026E1AE08|nr:hypothetical protein [Flavitalea sp. BT771]MDO6430452.1 hypothetical protein [Flavitalea sp. BT771]MDV6219408.1 hypothetical protein [Flavitalea sp. BT771]
MRKLLYIAGILMLMLVAGYFITHAVIRRQLDEALLKLPSSLKVTYGSVNPDILGRSLVVNDIQATDSGRRLSARRLVIHGINYLSLAASRKNISLTSITLAGIKAEQPAKFFMAGDLELDSVRIADLDHPTDSFLFGAIRLNAEKLSITPPGAYQTIHVTHLLLDSKRSSLQIDSLKLIPTVDKKELGGIKGHQVDCVTASGEGVQIEALDVMALLHHRLIADKITIRHNNIYVFRDRRLPLQPGRKPLPMDYLKDLPLSIRVQSVKVGKSTFSYEEFPAKGNKTGVLKILHMTISVSPFINHPAAGDPAYVTLVTEGSLMGSGSVTATTKMPLRKGDPYRVEGAFHQLDVTTLNPPAENLGSIHLESGMLNSLAFQFEMTEEKATGRIIGEYHGLVVDKLRGKDEKKVDKVKSFFLKHFIIPKDKDRTLPESKRTGKVDYKHDPERYFSYYLLHALLVGVKSSFSLGFLLPG